MAITSHITVGYTIVLLVILQAATCYDFQVEPRRVTVRPGQKVNILCRSSVPLTLCSFLLPGDAVVDLSQGVRTSATPEYRYFGTGLEYGQCGITLNSPPTGFNNVACRGWTETEGWMRAAMFLRVTTTPTLQWELTPQHAVVLPGEDVNFLCRSRLLLTDCRFGLMQQDRWLSYTQGAATAATQEFQYLGTGLDKGQCGITMFKVKEDMSGDVRCVGVANTRWAGDFMTLVVAKSPDAPDLQIISAELRDGDTMEATCAVRNARPAANITWYLDREQLDADVVDVTPGDTWYDYELQSTVQKVTMRVGHGDHGRELKCVASHIALFDYVNQDTKVIDVKFPPRDVKLPTRNSGIIVGRSSVLKVEIRANPQPILTWTIGETVVKDDDVGATGRYKAVLAKRKGLGKWEASLHIRDFTSADLAVDYQLHARNQIGGNNFDIRLPGGTGGGSSTHTAVTKPGAIPPRPARPVTKPQQTPVRPKPTPASEVCGHAILTTPLIVNGSSTQEGHWPWTTAIFAKKPRSAGLEFQCGGTLINKKHVVTAAHCIVIDSRTTLTHDDLLVFLGKYNLNEWAEPHSQLKKVS